MSDEKTDDERLEKIAFGYFKLIERLKQVDEELEEIYNRNWEGDRDYNGFSFALSDVCDLVGRKKDWINKGGYADEWEEGNYDRRSPLEWYDPKIHKTPLQDLEKCFYLYLERKSLRGLKGKFTRQLYYAGRRLEIKLA